MSSASDTLTHVEVIPIHPGAVQSVWPQVEPLVANALAEADGEWLPEDVLESLRVGDAGLLMVVGYEGLLGIMTTTIVIYPRKRVLRLWLLAGRDLATWIKAADDKLVELARERGCDTLEGIGRKGWARTATKVGWRVADTVMRRRVE